MASNTITRAYRPILESLDLTYPQYLVMMALWEKDNILINELKAVTHIDSGALTLILKKMQKKGFLDVVASDSDKRKKFICLTEQGRQLQTRALTIPGQILCQFPHMRPDQLTELKALLDTLLINNTGDASHD